MYETATRLYMTNAARLQIQTDCVLLCVFHSSYSKCSLFILHNHPQEPTAKLMNFSHTLFLTCMKLPSKNEMTISNKLLIN